MKQSFKVRGRQMHTGIDALLVGLMQAGGGLFVSTTRGGKGTLRFSYFDGFYKKVKVVSCTIDYNEKTDTYTFSTKGIVEGETYSH